jgi:ATP-dependent Clp protease ATP-binding subunit ClpC
MDASNIIKPALSRGELQCIGATTLTSTASSSRRTPRWSAASSPSWSGSPRVPETMEILKGLRDKYEAHHRQDLR